MHALICTEHSQRLYPKQGTTSFLATVVLPKGYEQTAATLSALNECCGKTGQGAVMEGIHSEVCRIHGTTESPKPAPTGMRVCPCPVVALCVYNTSSLCIVGSDI